MECLGNGYNWENQGVLGCGNHENLSGRGCRRKKKVGWWGGDTEH